MRRLLLLFLAVLVAAFVAFYPYLDGAGLCDDGGCPEIAQVSSAASIGSSAACCPLAVLAVATAALALVPFRWYRPAADHPRLIGLHLSPDPPPPRAFQTA